MKYALFFFCLTTVSLRTVGQKIHFCHTTNQWEIEHIYRGLGTETKQWQQIHFSGDTILFGKEFLMLDGQYIREDTFAHTIYLTSPGETSEHRLYDYNLLPGDTLQNTTKTWVVGMSSIQINSVNYRVWQMKGKDNLSYHIIEGLGCPEGLFLPAIASIQTGYTITNSLTRMFCFKNKGIAYPLFPSIQVAYTGVTLYNYVFDNIGLCALGEPLLQLPENITTVIPSPMIESAKIVFPFVREGNIIISNSFGQLITHQIRNATNIYIGNDIKLPGLYYYLITNQTTGQTFTGKFVKQ